jgi:hypothetical protein
MIYRKGVEQFEERENPLLERFQDEMCQLRSQIRETTIALAESYPLNTIVISDMFGVERAQSITRNWIHKEELQPETGSTPGHVSGDKTVIQLNGQRLCGPFREITRTTRGRSYRVTRR